MIIREAIVKDKLEILKFCKDTFSWGDYIEHVWDFWISEGSLLVCEIQSPVGICHAFYSKDQIWIEGIRINPNFRKQKIASQLIKQSELNGKKQNALFSYMLIDTENEISLSMATSLDYTIFQTWNFYALEPKINSNFSIQFEKSLNPNIYTHYVHSWRWIPIDDDTLSKFYPQNKIIKSKIDDKYSIAILTDSEHFEKTLIVTLFSGSINSTLQIINFLQNYGIENDYERIQILTKEQLLSFNSLDHKLSFHLMKKSLT
jgi:hypothetical protein